MSKVVRFYKTGGPEVLELVNVPVGEPGPGEVRIRHTAIGVNYIDTYHRSGLYPLPLPSGLGSEAAGGEYVHEAVHRGVQRRIEMPQRMMQPGGRLERDAGGAAGGQHQRDLFGRGKRGGIEPAGA